jgi:chemotaxis protein methyltransferase CheR
LCVRDGECGELIRWAAAELGLRAEGFRRVGRQVCKRLHRRMAELGVARAAYQQLVATDALERARLEEICRVHVSRFHRDRAVFEGLRERVLPALADRAAGGVLRIWSAGCAAGEEPYTLALLWHLALAARFPDRRLEVVATDADPASIERARLACYPRSSLKELPADWQRTAFVQREGRACLRPELHAGVELRCEDLRLTAPAGVFALILCRNLAFTYFDQPTQRSVARRLTSALAPGGALLIGARERLPAGLPLAADPRLPTLYWAASS